MFLKKEEEYNREYYNKTKIYKLFGPSISSINVDYFILFSQRN